jgi:hypothetical protein
MGIHRPRLPLEHLFVKEFISQRLETDLVQELEEQIFRTLLRVTRIA